MAPHIAERLRSLLDEHGGAYADARLRRRTDLAGTALVVAATNDGAVNARVVADARDARVLVCDAADAGGGDFTMPATARAGDLTISVDSGGSAPAFSAGSRANSRSADPILGARRAPCGRCARMRSPTSKKRSPQASAAPILRALAERPVDELAAMHGADARLRVAGEARWQ